MGLIAAALLLPAFTAAQEMPPPPPIMRITVTLIQVDAVVTDSKGRRVPNLGPEDFELLQDGRPQKITHFAYVPQPPPALEAPKLIGAPAPITRAQVRRTVALVVDDRNLSFENLVRAREGVRTYVERHMQPGDLVALVRTGGGVALLEQFIHDQRLLLEAVDLLKWRFPMRYGMIPLDPLPPGVGPEWNTPGTGPEVLDYAYSLPVLGSLGALMEVIRGMRGMPGRKSVVFICDRLPMLSEITEAVDQLTDLANRSAVSVYTIDPGGLRPPGWIHQFDPKEPAFMTQSSRVSVTHRPLELQPEFPEQEGLTDLAERTGGLAYFHNDIPGAIRQAADDQLGYYLLAYSPGEDTFEGPSRGKFHRVSVLVKRPGLRVRWKSGFHGLPDALPGTDEGFQLRTRQEQIVEALSSPFAASGIKLRLTSLVYAGKDGPGVRSMLVFDGKDLEFKREPGGGWSAAVEIISSAYRGIKQPMQQHQWLREIRLPDELYQRSLKEGFLWEFVHPMKESGAFLLRTVVRDVASGRIGSASQYVRVPDMRKGRLGVSGIVIKLAPPEILPAAFAAEAAPRDGHAEAWTEGGPALRRYRSGQALAYGYVVINPKRKGREKAPETFTQLRIFRNGKLLHEGRPVPLDKEGAIDERRFVAAGVLRLGRRLKPGEYILQVTVTDKLAKKKESQVSEWIDFEVVAPES